MVTRTRAAAIALILVLFARPALTQSVIGGTINSYWPVISVDICNNRVALPSIVVGVNIGDKMLLMQMQGAIIDTSDSPSYGTITDYNGAGNYELLTVSDVTNNIITFQEAIMRSYDPDGKVQVVLVPQYGDVLVAAALTAQPWNGSSGGVIALISSGAVTLNADIDATGAGFRGGLAINDAFCYAGGLGYDGYRCTAVLAGGASKGEGIAGALFQNLARGAPANGGGGGNDSNTGGGGGGHIVAGGNGGIRTNISPGCTGSNPGLGGHSLVVNNVDVRAFAGGGGGAGDGNSGGATSGSNGGGIILIRANAIVPNGFTLRAQGADVTSVASLDGAGGGGAGGMILLDVPDLTGVNVNVSGGKGGDAANPSAANDSCFGPGGGGAAGLVFVSAFSPSGIVELNGGLAGSATGGLCTGANGATDGAGASAVFTSYVIPESDVPFVTLTLNVCNDTAVCKGEPALLCASGTGTGTITFEWSDGQNGDQVEVYPDATSVYSVSVIDSRGCSITENMTVTVNSTSTTAFASPDSIVIGHGLVYLTADTAGNQLFQWDPPTWLTDPTVWNPIADPQDTVTYCVTVTGYNGCKDTSCVDVLVVIPPPAIFIPTAFTPNGDGINDTWQIIANNACYTLDVVRVWNRWGMKVFDRSDGGSEWDGSLNGQPQAMETYFYYIVATCTEKPEAEEFFGSVTVIR
jgi:gliding motility-associated-like protein